jgi:APA family basic amino acid/polyamine antiporter
MPKKLKKELGLLDVYAIATGTTLSAGFFLLPGLAAQLAGTDMIFAYLIAVIPLVPAMFSITELATAMPRAGGVYYFLDRTLGPMIGTIGGIGTWLALILKVAFALIGMGAYISLFYNGLNITYLALMIAILLGVLNLFGSQKSSKVQIIMVLSLVSILVIFILDGVWHFNPDAFDNILTTPATNIFATAGLVFISYVGITKVASLSEEIKNPERNLPMGIFLAIGTAIVVYVLGTSILVSLVPMPALKGSLTPVATAAQILAGDIGMVTITIAAILAFLSVANAGTLSASRYPLAMSRDAMVPEVFQSISKWGTPYFGVILTTLIIALILLLFDPTKIAKLASTFQLLMFALICIGVIVMRESRIEAYDPGFRSPFYPWLQIIGVFFSFLLIFEMGIMSTLFSLGLLVSGGFWYWYYGRKRVTRNGAIYHIFERLGRKRFEGLDYELRGILKEKGLRTNDPFEEIVAHSQVIEINHNATFEEIVHQVAQVYAGIIPHTTAEIEAKFLEGTRIGATPVTHDVALPHFRSDGIARSEMVLVRSRHGIRIQVPDFIGAAQAVEKNVFGLFFLVSPENDPAQHLRILAKIAERVDDKSFAADWEAADSLHKLKQTLIKDENSINLRIEKELGTSHMINKTLKEIRFPQGCLVATLQRGTHAIIPNGNTILMEGDRIIVFGEAGSIQKCREKYLD